MASCHQKHNNIDAGVEGRFRFEGFSIPDEREADRNPFSHHKHAHTHGQPRQMEALSVPAAGLVPAALVTEARAHEHVLVDPSTQAVNV